MLKYNLQKIAFYLTIVIPFSVSAIDFEKEITPRLKSLATAFVIGEAIDASNQGSPAGGIINKFGISIVLDTVANDALSKNALQAIALSTLLNFKKVDSNDPIKEELNKIIDVQIKQLTPPKQLAERAGRFIQRCVIEEIITPYSIEALEQTGLSTSCAYLVTGITKLCVNATIANAARSTSNQAVIESSKYLYGNEYSDFMNAGYYFLYPKNNQLYEKELSKKE